MPHWLERTTKRLTTSSSPSAMERTYGGSFKDVAGKGTSNASHIMSPDLAAVRGQPNRYWLTTDLAGGDAVILADAATRTAIDAAVAQFQLDTGRAEAVVRADLDIGFRAQVEALLFEVNKCNTRIQELQDALNAAINGSGGTANLRTELASIALSNVRPKTRGQVLQKIVDDINAGTADP